MSGIAGPLWADLARSAVVTRESTAVRALSARPRAAAGRAACAREIADTVAEDDHQDVQLGGVLNNRMAGRPSQQRRVQVAAGQAPKRAASQWAEQVCDRILRVHVGHSARDYGGADDVFITRVGSSQARGAEHWHMFHLTIR
jgi:hypothetical protein